ncbi:unnamed protein product [Zymoseptoria tritici ST99CH_1A5]|nr:unnamed protein product [Zymoseptoria tritici ST99CH_1A5]
MPLPTFDVHRTHQSSDIDGPPYETAAPRKQRIFTCLLHFNAASSYMRRFTLLSSSSRSSAHPLLRQQRLWSHDTTPAHLCPSRFGSVRHARNKTSRMADGDIPSFPPAPPLPFIARFYGTEEAKDLEGRTLSQILRFDDEKLERSHDYIQNLFPLPERSPVNPDAPLLDQATRSAFLYSPVRNHLRAQLLEAFKRMAAFYGFTLDTNDTTDNHDAAKTAISYRYAITPSLNFFANARQTWLTRGDHNHLRITRIIRCLRILGLEPVALAFYQALIDNSGDVVSARSKMYWQRAAERPLHLPPAESDEDATGIEWLNGVS